MQEGEVGCEFKLTVETGANMYFASHWLLQLLRLRAKRKTQLTTVRSQSESHPLQRKVKHANRCILCIYINL